MPIPSPNITLTGTFVDMQGVAVNGGTVTATLMNFGSNVPQLSGSAVLETIVTTATMTSTNTFSMALYGNDQISPTGTYYQVSFPGPGVNTTIKNYQLTGVGSFDLSNLTPFGSNPTPQSQPGQTLVSPLAVVANTFVAGLSTSGTLITGLVSTPAAIIDNQHPNTAVTGIGGNLQLMATTIGAGVMAAGKGVIVTFAFRHTTGSASVAYSITYGATTIASWSSTSANSIFVRVHVLNNPALTNSQIVVVEPILDGTSVVAANTLPGAGISATSNNSTIAQNVALAFNVAATDQVTKLSVWTQLLQ